MYTKDLVSIIIPVYNIEKFLPLCLETVVAQTYKNLEIILVDDGSTDGSGVLCDDFASHDNRAVVVHKPNGGLGSARNTGLEHATGEYVMFIDGDDYIHREMVNTLHSAINRYGGGKISMCSFQFTNSFNEDTKSAPEKLMVKVLNLDDILDSYFKRISDLPYKSVCNKLYQHSLLEGISFREYKHGEDADFMFRLYIKAEQMAYVDKKMYFYVMRNGSLVHQGKSWLYFYHSITDMRYRHFMEMPSEMRQRYSHYVLKELYRKMAEYKYITRGTTEYDNACQQCRKYTKDTRKAYWSNRRISIFEKILSTMQLQFPFMVGWLTALRRIIRPQPQMPKAVSG